MLRTVNLSEARASVAVMQPYFFPYLGYWQLVSKVDKFVLLESVQFPKGGWVNRNRLLGSQSAELITVPLSKASTFAPISERRVSSSWNQTKSKTLKRLESTYFSAPYFEEIFPWLEGQLFPEETQLASFLGAQIQATVTLLGLDTEILSDRELGDFGGFIGKDRVITICKVLGGRSYANLPGGRHLYRSADFEQFGLRLGFIDPQLVHYDQKRPSFSPNLSIIDALFWLGPEATALVAKSGSIEWA